MPREHEEQSAPDAQTAARHPDLTGAGASSDLQPILVLALDGATFDVIRPLADAGELPHLARWMKSGQSAPLPSTIPPVTFPAWSSFMTGVAPGEHGIFDFTQKRAGEYRLRFINSTDRDAPSIFSRIDRAGGSVLVLGLPATHPPEKLRGLLVCGFDAPVSAGTDERSANDPALYREIAHVAGPWMRPQLDESARADDFHERAVQTLLERIDRKRDFALEAIRRVRARNDGQPPALTMVVFSESDTAGHHYWRDHDPASPRHAEKGSATRRRALSDVYRRLDEACGALRAEIGESLPCVVMSDHGMGGASDQVIHLNRFLAERGYLTRRDGIGRFGDRLARRLRDRALAWLPARLAQQIFRRARGAAAEIESRARFGGLDWARTRAFSEEANTNPGIWINLAGREAEGCVDPDEYEALRDQLIADLEAWQGPQGRPVIARALRREAVHPGRHQERAPDLVLELAIHDGYGPSLVPTPWAEGGRQGDGIPSVRTLAAADHAGGRGRGMNGTHRSNGIWIADPGFPLDEEASSRTGPDRVIPPPPAGLVGVAPWLARAMGLAWESRDHDAPRDATTRVSAPYDEDEEAMVAERLRALGYLE